MDNKLRSVVQFAFYTLFFSLKNTIGLGIKVEYAIQALYFVICFFQFYLLNKNIKRYQKQSNLIQKLIQLILITLMITSLPLENQLGVEYFQLFREAMELINQSILFYMWLTAFEQSLEKYNQEKQQSNKMISILKILFICGYPLNSGLEIINRIFYQSEREYQILLGLELLYGIVFLFQYGHYYKYYQIHNISTGVNQKQHDPFDDELGDEEVDKQDSDSIMLDYFRFSLICCLALIVNTIVKVFQYERLNASFLKQQGIIVVYVYFVSNLVKGLDQFNVEQKSFIEMGNKQRSEETIQD